MRPRGALLAICEWASFGWPLPFSISSLVCVCVCEQQLPLPWFFAERRAYLPCSARVGALRWSPWGKVRQAEGAWSAVNPLAPACQGSSTPGPVGCGGPARQVGEVGFCEGPPLASCPRPAFSRLLTPPPPPLACQESQDPQWKRAMDYLGAISELNYMTQIVIMLYEDNNQVRGGGGGWPGPGCRLPACLPGGSRGTLWLAAPAGPLVRGEVPRGAALQPGREGLRGGRWRPGRLWLSPGFGRGRPGAPPHPPAPEEWHGWLLQAGPPSTGSWRGQWGGDGGIPAAAACREGP